MMGGIRGQFLETICIRDGIPQHLEWHQRRVDDTLRHFFPAHRHSRILVKCIELPVAYQKGIVRCRIVYDAHLVTIRYFHYTIRNIRSLKLMEIPEGMDYMYKYADRKMIEDLYNLRGDADDILMTRDGWITDTSIANIAFSKNGRWYTPSIPLLAGTTWKRLVKSGKLMTRPIHSTHLSGFDNFKIFNAMRDWEDTEETPIVNILF